MVLQTERTLIEGRLANAVSRHVEAGGAPISTKPAGRIKELFSSIFAIDDGIQEIIEDNKVIEAEINCSQPA